ncbi:protein NKG7-like [Carettochelys insculpta]|uniref:protein NKG7-like n=1 Tax=Carettochelys insculpta TaxID=44489 RepID=UPI003EBB6786
MILFRIASVPLALLSLVLVLVTLVSDNWVNINEREGSHCGLWRACFLQSCIMYTAGVPGFFHTTRSFLILASLAGCFSFFVLIASLFCSHVRSVSLVMASTMGSFSAGLGTMTGMAVFTSACSPDSMPAALTYTWSYSWSYGLGWLSFFLFLGTGAVTLLAQRSSYSPL